MKKGCPPRFSSCVVEPKVGILLLLALVNVDQPGIALRPSLRPQGNSTAAIDQKLAAAVSETIKKQLVARMLKLHRV